MVKGFPDLGRRMQEQRQLLHVAFAKQSIFMTRTYMLWHPTSLNFMHNVVNENQSPVIAVTKGCQVNFLVGGGLLVKKFTHVPETIMYDLREGSLRGLEEGGIVKDLGFKWYCFCIFL
ncbi:uncharacterized protein LOC110271496 [Arachis ipaensis]|uniref:uncharacterized protein LOC110271496 n=1 Tax=Arachis ipaensis TaxID=130454 RepID=UPI000A2B4730|nr:uncharacterized protein LOC110271496 [Arachis ipaensis]